RRLIDRLSRKKLAPSSITSTVNIVSGMLRFGIKVGALERNPVRDLDRDDRPGARRLSEPRYLTVAEVRRLLAAMSESFRPVAATCAYAGLRISEALGLTWREVDFKASTLTVSRQLGGDGELVPLKTTTSAATLPLLPELATELRAHRRRQVARGLH